MNKQSLLYTVIFTFLVTFVFVAVLAFADIQTQEQVALNQEIARKKAILSALSVETATPEEVLRRFEEVEQVERERVTLYRTEVDGRNVYAKEFTGSGLWGSISGVLGVDADVQNTVGIEIVAQNETPGLGARIDEPWFKEQLEGERIVDGMISVGPPGEGDPDHENGRVDSITGATRTSESMQKILDTEITRLRSLLGGQS